MTQEASQRAQSPQGHASSAVAAALAAALVVVVLVTWAAAIGPSDVLRGDGTAVSTDNPTSETPTASVSSGSPTPSAADPERQHGSSDVGSWVRALAFLIEVATLLLVLFLLWRGVRWARQTYGARDRRAPPPEDVDFEVIRAPEAADEVRRDAGVQRGLLDEGPPRDAIVACWERFEVQALAAGLGRKHWETSAEFTLRFLDLVATDEHAVARLAELYREARFSDHVMGEDARDEARRALAGIHAGLVRPAVRGPW
jgi:hypothetical protein